MKRRKIDSLPDKVKRELDGELVKRGFADYVELSAWLKSLGYDISKSALHRHGSQLQESHAEAMLAARELLALTRASGELGDSGAEMSRHGAVILQSDIIKTSLEIRREEDPEKRASLLAKLTRAHADIGRMVIAADEYKNKVRDKLAVLESQAGGGKAGFDLETLKRVREEIYGIM